MLASKTLSVYIGRPWNEVYEAFYRPEMFARWASGLSKAELSPAGETWTGHGAEGPISVRFTPHNPFGIMDHWVDTGADSPVYIPLRVIPNEQGAEVILTVYRQRGMTDAKFEEDQHWVDKDLRSLKALAETAKA